MHLGGWDNDASQSSRSATQDWEMAVGGDPNSPSGASDKMSPLQNQTQQGIYKSVIRPNSPLSDGTSSPLIGIRVDLSPKKMSDNRASSPIMMEEHLAEVPETIPAPVLAPPRKFSAEAIDRGSGQGFRPHTVASAMVEPSSYAVNYFGIHRGEMGMLSHRRNIPQLSGKEVAQKKVSAQVGIGGGFVKRIPKSSDPRVKNLTPFGQSLVVAAASSMESEELLSPNVKLDPTYKYLLVDTANRIQFVSPPNNKASGRMSPTILDDDERTVNSQISAHSFERNPVFSPTTDKILDDDDRTLDSEMAKTHFSHVSRASHSTLGVPNPVRYDHWLSNNALPVRSSLSRGGLQSASSASLRGPVYSVGLSSSRGSKAMRQSQSSSGLHADHGMAPVAKGVGEEKSLDTARQDTFMSEQEEEIPYVVHSTPMGWKLTTAARKKYVEATARIAGYGDNEFLPMPAKLSKLADTMGVPPEFDRSLRGGGSGPAPSLGSSALARNAVSSRSKSAQAQAVVRMGAGTLKWRGIENHKLQLKRVDAKLKGAISATNRPNNLVDAGESVYGSIAGSSVEGGTKKKKGHRILVGGKRTRGRKFKGLGREEGTGMEDGGGIVGMEVAIGDLFGPDRIV
jgi:hypothetical protein